jgi:hypothetical protein
MSSDVAADGTKWRRKIHGRNVIFIPRKEKEMII